MSIWKLVVEYDGSKYSGWQAQANARTVQGQLIGAARDFLRAEVEVQGAGRTDAGVHALGQVASLKAMVRHPPLPDELMQGLNEGLPADCAVLSVEPAPPRFHPRHDARSRTYLYRISKRKNAFAKRYVWWIREPLDIAAMQRASRMLIGRHNFICFRAADPSKPDESTIVVVESAEVDIHGDEIQFRITASHFLWRMVRRVVGVLVKVGMGDVTEADLAQLLQGKCEKRLDVAAWTAPASGLFLESVKY